MAPLSAMLNKFLYRVSGVKTFYTFLTVYLGLGDGELRRGEVASCGRLQLYLTLIL